MLNLETIKEANKILKNIVFKTPFSYAKYLSKVTNYNIFFKKRKFTNYRLF